jgi:large subunit ribosomal protein L6
LSRIGKKAITVPSGVSVTLLESTVKVKGPKGELSAVLADKVSARQEGSELILARADESRVARANHGLARALVANMVRGVHEGFSKRLEIHGIGYRAEVKGAKLVLNLGYSHQIEYEIPVDIKIAVDKDNKIVVSGVDRAHVGQVAANIRDFRKPDRYKGKGVRYEGEFISLKAGKSA